MAAPMKLCVSRPPLCFQRKFLRHVIKHVKLSSYATATDSETLNAPPSNKKTRVELDEKFSEALASNSEKHKHHPGRHVLPSISLPQRLIESAGIILEKYPMKELSRKADKLANYLWSRHPPATDSHVSKLASQIHEQLVQKKEKAGKTSPVERDDVLRTLRQKVYHWQPVAYDAYKSLLYLTAHLAHNYSVLLQCFTEISKREPAFQPRSVYNLGSGLGSAIWAANSVWGSRVFEYYCVDTSQDMNTVARLLLQDADSQKQMCFPGVAFRQFPPSPFNNQFEMVVSAYTLLENPGQRQQRLEMVDDLWRMTTDFLVLVENGTTAGFSVINEARDHILKVSNTTDDERLKGYIFAPCPHDDVCPKFAEMNQPCFSQVHYKPLPQNHTRPSKCNARYSYLIMRKGARKGVPWPRVIQDTMKASRHTHCHLCCPDRKIRHMIFTASKHGQDVYKCSRHTSWGDQFPVTFTTDADEE
ncbi:ribosome assembly protein METTL17, mitochondrial-like [Littorina saxatilis]|uniref:ribosome assembly protein METTL17, mitochondrial-like n=1 Tax=Littorina saxatilis TaxID=31220 RepID=UPI0038B504CE